MSKTKKRERYFGIVKVQKSKKYVWLSKQDKHGWSLGFALNARTVWLRGLRFPTTKDIEKTFQKPSKLVTIPLKKHD
jgi:hypothetical protein